MVKFEQLKVGNWVRVWYTYDIIRSITYQGIHQSLKVPFWVIEFNNFPVGMSAFEDSWWDSPADVPEEMKYKYNR